MMYTIGQMAKVVGLSRGTLLHYDKIGLLRPSTRTESNYRVYNDEDLARLQQIVIYRDAGLSLGNIAQLLDKPVNETVAILQNQLALINEEIADLRRQQQSILGLIGGDGLLQNTRIMNKEQWVMILKTAGWSEVDMINWHAVFEQNYPEAHQDFLESLGIDEEEIVAIRTGMQ